MCKLIYSFEKWIIIHQISVISIQAKANFIDSFPLVDPSKIVVIDMNDYVSAIDSKLYYFSILYKYFLLEIIRL
jgi:hypothetical protein